MAFCCFKTMSRENPEETVGFLRKAEEMKKIRKNQSGKREKPDGGWGWMVVFGAALSNMSTQALTSVFGLLFLRRLSRLGIGTRGASIIVAVQMTTMNLSGLIIGPVMKKFSYRKTALLGSALVFIGLLLTMKAHSLSTIILSYSLFIGLGLGLSNPSSFVAIDSYFSKRKGRAVGLALSGTGIGQMMLPLLVQNLLTQFGFEGTVLILSSLALHALVGSCLYQPTKWHLRKKSEVEKCETAYQEEHNETNQTNGEMNPLLNKGSKLSEDVELDKGLGWKCCRALNVDLLANLSFFMHLSGLALVYVANICFSMLLPFFLESIEYPREIIAVCMSTLSGADILGRLIIPAVTSHLNFSSRTIFFLGAAVSAVTRSVLVCQKNLKGTLALAAVCGFIRSALIVNINLSISEQVPAEKLASALGLHMVFKGTAIMIFMNVIGFIRDYTGNYTTVLHTLSLFFLGLPFVMWLIEKKFFK